MKYILSFLFGAACGVGGTLLWLRKDIKHEMEIRSEASKSDDMPFVMGEHNDGDKEPESLRGAKNGLRSEDSDGIAARREERVNYNKIVNDIKSGVKPELKIPVLPREDYPEAHFDDGEGEEEEPVTEKTEDELVCFPIPIEDFTHDENYEKERYVYFRGDKIMCTEAGTIITTPALFVGNNWEEAIGRDAERTAFIRNPKLSTDYEIYVEEGLYEEEYGQQ